ncbi:2-oxoacid:acceptor oxidoreductase subunit alpha [Candidatus Korarchaeum cryptofilum]|nr:2-oxoacid:acceptor oxidoreductase subunit alpha [Candidatus Korarchaeum cryptofilum]
MPGELRLMTGYDALVEGAITAGCRFFAGYPITPSTEIAERMSNRLPKVGGIFIQMEDELASIIAIIGASWGGLKAMTATSGPGFSLMQEGLGFAIITETPIVLVDVMRGGPSTGLVTLPSQGDVMQARWGSHGDYAIIALAPWSSQEMFDLAIKAFNLAEIYRNPVIILSDEVVAHIREPIKIPPPDEIEVVERRKPSVPPTEFIPYLPDPGEWVSPMPAFGEGYNLLVESVMHDEFGHRIGMGQPIAERKIKRIYYKIEKNVEKIAMYEERGLEDADVAIVTYGSSARTSLKAMKDARNLGIKVGMLRLITLWPFYDKLIEELSSKVKSIVVPEMNMGKIVREVERASKGQCKILPVPKVGGVLHNPDEILSAVKLAAR